MDNKAKWVLESNANANANVEDWFCPYLELFTRMR